MYARYIYRIKVLRISMFEIIINPMFILNKYRFSLTHNVIKINMSLYLFYRKNSDFDKCHF
ncbi:hypothetical protein Hanom_Chr14g01252401 [Helianthus anomalus]